VFNHCSYLVAELNARMQQAGRIERERPTLLPAFTCNQVNVSRNINVSTMIRECKEREPTINHDKLTGLYGEHELSRSTESYSLPTGSNVSARSTERDAGGNWPIYNPSHLQRVATTGVQLGPS